MLAHQTKVNSTMTLDIEGVHTVQMKIEKIDLVEGIVRVVIDAPKEVRIAWCVKFPIRPKPRKEKAS